MPPIPVCPDCFDELVPALVETTAPSGWVDLLISDIALSYPVPSSKSSDPCAGLAATVRVYDKTGPAEVCVVVTVKNIGSKAATGFWADLFLDESTAPAVGDSSAWYGLVSSLSAGGTATVVYSGLAMPEAWVDVVLDTTRSVTEYRESNNVRALTRSSP